MREDGNSNSGFKKILAGTSIALGGWLAAKKLKKTLNSYRIKGKVVLITGGSRGLGLVLARQLANKGAKVAICGRSEKTLREASRDLSARTKEHISIPCDVTDPQQIKRMVQQVKGNLGSVDILINNAGNIQVGPMDTMTEEDYVSAMKVHFWGPFHAMNEVLPDMMKKGKGRIVNIVSIGGKVSFPHLLPYNTSKYALSGLSEGMSAELKRHNIKVTTVYPGLMRTGSPRNIDVKGQYEKEYAWFKISDSLPFVSMDVERAAGQIIKAMKEGSRTLTLSIPAKLAVAAHGIAPGVTITIFDFINSLLPGEEHGARSQKGYESESRVSSSFLTKKTDEAAEKTLQNER